MIQIMLTSLLAIMIYMTAIWLVSLRMKNAGIVDIFWGPGFALASWVVFALSLDGFSTRKLLIVALVSLWGLRLGWHIGRRNLGHDEDYRYQEWRKASGESWWWVSFFKVFVLQGVI